MLFLCLHGKGGEDGVLQGFLETIGLPYTGPGVWSSATAMNKAQSKLFYQREGIATAPINTSRRERDIPFKSLHWLWAEPVSETGYRRQRFGHLHRGRRRSYRRRHRACVRNRRALLSLRSIFKVLSSRLPCWAIGILSLYLSSRLFLKLIFMISNRNMRRWFAAYMPGTSR